MLRKLVILGLVAGGSASLPVVYQRNPEIFEGLVKSALEEPAPVPAPQRPLVVINQAKPEAPRGNPAGRKVRLEADERGHFNADFKINGRTIEALVDTGASMVAINLSTARRLGLGLGPSDFNREANTANGVIRAATATLDSVQIGKIVIRDVEAMVLEDKSLDGTLVGMSFLKELSMFRIESGALVMEQ